MPPLQPTETQQFVPRTAVHSKERNADAASPELLVTARAVNLFKGFFFFSILSVGRREVINMYLNACLFGKFHSSPHKLHYLNDTTLKLLCIFILLTSAVDSSKVNIF